MFYITHIKRFVAVIVLPILITGNIYQANSEEITHTYVPAEVIIKTKSSDFGKLGTLNQKFNITEIEWLEKNTYRLKMENPRENIKKVVKKYSQNQEIALVEPNYVLEAVATPTDPLFNLQWGFHNTGQTVNGTAGKVDIDVNAPEAWEVSTGTTSTTVAILDTGINASHEDLTGKIITGYDFVNNDTDASDDNGHGTMIAGVVGAISNNGKGIAGMNWNAKIMPIKVLDSGGSGTISTLIEGINFAVNNNATVVNMSLVGDYSNALDSTIRNAYDHGVLLVSAAGNGGINLDTTPMSPISNDGDGNWILGIGSVDQSGNASSFSNYSATYIDVVAPGTNILSAYLGNTAYVYASGTSISAGLVSGIASLVKDKDSTLTGQQVKQRILNSAKKVGLGSAFGKGSVDAHGALVARNSTTKKIGVMKKESGSDYNFYVYTTPASLTPQTLTGSDLWNIPSGNNSIATTGVDIDGDGVKELAVMKNDGGDYNLYVYNSPQGSSPQLIRAMDLWNIPSGDNVIAIAGVDYNGDGRDELAVMKNENRDYNMYIYFAPTTTEATYLIGGDKWNIPSGDNVIAMTGIDIDGDFRDEIAVMKNEGGDHNLYIYRAPNGMVSAELAGTDKWAIPSGDNTIGITGVDINGDGRDEIGIIKNEEGDHNFYVYQAPIGTGAMQLLSGDKWNIPSGDNVVGIATVE